MTNKVGGESPAIGGLDASQEEAKCLRLKTSAHNKRLHEVLESIRSCKHLRLLLITDENPPDSTYFIFFVVNDTQLSCNECVVVEKAMTEKASDSQTNVIKWHWNVSPEKIVLIILVRYRDEANELQ